VCQLCSEQVLHAVVRGKGREGKRRRPTAID
jgi:hypothetical protein